MVGKSLVRITKALQSLVADADLLAAAAAQGNLGTRADASRHVGDYRKIIEGINRTLDIVVEPLKTAAQSAIALASSSEEMTAVSQQMAGNAEETASTTLDVCSLPATESDITADVYDHVGNVDGHHSFQFIRVFGGTPLWLPLIERQ